MGLQHLVILLLLATASAKRLREDASQSLDAQEVVASTGDLAKAASAKRLQEHASESLDAQQVVAVNDRDKIGLKGSIRKFFCGMFHIKFAHVVELSIGASVDITITKESGSKWTITVAGLLGGGFTFGPQEIWHASVMATHQVEFTATLPTWFNNPKVNAFKGLRWAATEWFNAKKQRNPSNRFVRLNGNVDNVLRLKAVYEHEIEKEYKLTDHAVAGGWTLNSATNEMILRDNIDGILNFAAEFEHFLNKQSSSMTEAAYIEGIQRAYWASHVNHACSELQVKTAYVRHLTAAGDKTCDGKKCDKKNCHFTTGPTTGWFPPFGLGATNGPPDCRTINKEVGAKDHRGYYNLLCGFMSAAALIERDNADQQYKAASGGVKGMKNMLDMIPIIFGKSLSGTQESVGLFPQREQGGLDVQTILQKETRDGKQVLVWFESLQLGKWLSPASSKVMLRALGHVFATESFHLREKLQVLMDKHAQPDPNLSCPAGADPSVCGVSAYKVLTTYAITTGFGHGSINFCTPDTNMVQLYRGYSYQYQLKNNIWEVTDKEWSHKITLAGQTYFHIDLTKYSGTGGDYWEPKIRITVPGDKMPVGNDVFAGWEDPPPDLDAEPNRQQLVEEFIEHKIVPWLGKAIKALTTPGLTMALLKSAWEGLKQDFKDSLDTRPKHKFRSVHQVAAAMKEEDCEKETAPDKKCKSPAEAMGALSFKSVMAMIAAGATMTFRGGGAQCLKDAVAAAASVAFPLKMKQTFQFGIQFGCKITKIGGKWKLSHVLFDMFFLQYRSFEVTSQPWAEMMIGVDINIGGYIGTEAKFEMEYTKATEVRESDI